MARVLAKDDIAELYGRHQTETSTLGSYYVSTTASHYDWAMKKIKQHRKTKQNPF